MELKFNYTHQNHFKWGWGDDWYNKPDPTQKYKIHLGHVSRPVGSFRQECINAARLIADKATKPIIIGLSGGSDSQIVCLSFMEIGVPFKVVIVKLYTGDGKLCNGHDIATAYEFCKKFNLEYIEFSLNMDKFYRTTGSEYAQKYGFTGVQTIIQCATMDFVCKDYCYIMAGGDIIMTTVMPGMFPEKKIATMPNCKGTDLIWWQAPLPIMQHMIAMEYEGTSKFYLYTPELISAYLMDPVVQDFLRARNVLFHVYTTWHPNQRMWWRFFHLLIKPMMTLREWPEMIPTRKYTGFEQLQGADHMSGKEAEFQEIINRASGGKTLGQAVAPTIMELIDYIHTPHTHSLEAVKTNNHGSLRI